MLVADTPCKTTEEMPKQENGSPKKGFWFSLSKIAEKFHSSKATEVDQSVIYDLLGSED